MRSPLPVLVVAVFLSAHTIAQGVHDPLPSQSPSKIRIVFPNGMSDDEVWLVYGLYASPGHKGGFIGLDGPVGKVRRLPVPHISGQGHFVAPANAPAFYEIDGVLDGERVERFQALAWAPGCNMTSFDVQEIGGDLEEHFTCVTQKRIAVAGRIQGVDLKARPETVWVSYYGGPSCFTFHLCDKGGCAVSCAGIAILDMESAAVASDGSFTIEVPDFSDDPVASFGAIGFLFSVGQSREHRVWLQPESPDLRSFSGHLKLAPTYPTSVVFLPNAKLQ